MLECLRRRNLPTEFCLMKQQQSTTGITVKLRAKRFTLVEVTGLIRAQVDSVSTSRACEINFFVCEKY